MSQPFTTTELDPLTHEELMTHEKVIEDAKEVGLISFVVKVDFYAKLITAARASIPRPISEAPKDGTEVIIHDGYDRFQNATFAHGFWFSKVTGEIIHDPIAFLPIPKGGAS